jgi:hypothetical protein
MFLIREVGNELCMVVKGQEGNSFPLSTCQAQGWAFGSAFILFNPYDNPVK